MAILIEHFNGAFPFWLAPEQVRVLAVSDRHLEYARSLADDLAAGGLRAAADERSETLGKKIRDAQRDKLPVMLVVGDDEVAAGSATPRLRSGEQLAAVARADLPAWLATLDAASRNPEPV